MRFCLQHSNRWDPYTLSNIEYGDSTSVMGLSDWGRLLRTLVVHYHSCERSLDACSLTQLPFPRAADVPGSDFPGGYKHAVNWIPESFMVDVTKASAAATRPFSLGSIRIVNTTTNGVASTVLPLTLRAVSAWGVSDHFVYGTYAPNIPGSSSALFLHLISLGWTDLYSHDGTSNSFNDGTIGNSFMVDVHPGTYTHEDAPLYPGDSFAYGAWYSPASGQNVSSLGTFNGIANTTSMILFENLAAVGTSSLNLRTTTISASTGERPEGRGCDASGCVAPAVPVPLVCGVSATATLTRLNPTALWKVSLPPSAGEVAQMITLSTCSSSEPTELGAYRSIPYAQVSKTNKAFKLL
jgi:hypothetical protein